MSTSEIQVVFSTPMMLGESPLWHPDESALYWIDIAGRAVHRLHTGSQVHHSWGLPSEPGCIARCDGGGLIIAMRVGLARLDTNTGTLQMIAEAPYEPSQIRFNDGCCDAAGRLWAGTLLDSRAEPKGSLYCIERGMVRDAGKPVTVSNGVAFSANNRTLYHADTTAHRIMAYDYNVATGRIGDGRLFQQFPNDRSTPSYGGRPDGAAVDSEDAYWCAMMEGGRLLRFAPSGELLREIRLPVRCPTMIAFGGEDLRTLYITTVRHHRSPEELATYPLSGCVLSLRVDVPGRIQPSYIA